MNSVTKLVEHLSLVKCREVLRAEKSSELPKEVAGFILDSGDTFTQAITLNRIREEVAEKVINLFERGKL